MSHTVTITRLPDEQNDDYEFEQVGTNETFKGLTLGTYPVRIEWEDDWWLEVQNPTTAIPESTTDTKGTP